MVTAPADDLLTVHDAAHLLGLTEPTVRRYVTEGKLPAIQLGGTPRGQLRISRSDLDACIRRWGAR